MNNGAFPKETPKKVHGGFMIDLSTRHGKCVLFVDKDGLIHESDGRKVEESDYTIAFTLLHRMGETKLAQKTLKHKHRLF